jgi:hypothetical protein
MLSIAKIKAICATSVDAKESVFEHVLHESDYEWNSQYISTCGSLDAVLKLCVNTDTKNPTIAKIWELDLPLVKYFDRPKFNMRRRNMPD